jgi:hypothetical protein
MILYDLYNEILIDPLQKGGDNLFIVSGYASATFANRHLRESDNFKLNLIIGMPGKRSDHLGYLNLYKRYEGRFNGYYLKGSPPVHCKLYAWYHENNELSGYSGSANYSQYGFIHTNQINQLIDTDPVVIKGFYDELLPRCIPIPEFKYDIREDEDELIEYEQLENSVDPGEIQWEVPDKRVRISFLSSDGLLPQRSGLNWGQRPEYNRNPNQAYLSLRKDSRKEGFLPELALTFTLVTDDNQSLDCSVAQQGRKAIHSTFDNSEIGLYIRNRLGVPSGELITRNHLENYGRTDYTIEKIDDETFLFDLSVD